MSTEHKICLFSLGRSYLLVIWILGIVLHCSMVHSRWLNRLRAIAFWQHGPSLSLDCIVSSLTPHILELKKIYIANAFRILCQIAFQGKLKLKLKLLFMRYFNLKDGRFDIAKYKSWRMARKTKGIEGAWKLYKMEQFIIVKRLHCCDADCIRCLSSLSISKWGWLFSRYRYVQTFSEFIFDILDYENLEHLTQTWTTLPSK